MPDFSTVSSPGLQPDDFFQRQQMNAPQVVVGVGRRKSVQVRPADRGEQQRVRMLVDLFVQVAVDVHGSSSDIAARPALMRNVVGPFVVRAFGQLGLRQCLVELGVQAEPPPLGLLPRHFASS